VNQPAILLISLLLPTILFGESAQAQPSSVKSQSVFAPYQPEPKFAPAIKTLPQPKVAPGDRENSPNIEARPGQAPSQNPNRTPNQNPNQATNQSPSQSADPANDQVPFTTTPDGVPALNIVPTVERPPIPPPPDAAPLRPNGNGIARPAQAWRVKAFQLFKQKLDPNTTLALVLNANYNNVLLSLRQAVEDVGLTVSSVSSSSGHMLITTNNEKAIVALRQALPDAKSDMRSEAKADARPEAKTEVRILCESRNKSLTTGRMKEILNKLQSKFGDIKTDAETL
jgi:hypothetical protein